MQSLISILRGVLQNCCVAEFDDFRVQDAIGREVADLPNEFDRKLLKSLLATLQKRNRFIYCLSTELAGKQTDHDAAVQQAARALLDRLLLRDGVPATPPARGIEIATLRNYQHTNFESERMRLAAEGSTLAEGAMAEADFLDKHFGKAVRYATHIEICDKIFGSKFADNYIHTTKTMMKEVHDLLQRHSPGRLPPISV